MVFGWLVFLWSCAGTAVDGVVTDALTGQPVADFVVMAKAKEATDMGCSALTAKTDAAGTFRLEGLCGVPYEFSAKKSEEVDLWFVDGAELAKDFQGSVKLSLMRTPSSPGVYKLVDGKYDPLRTAADLKTREVLNTTEKVRFPSKLPDEVPLVTGQEQIVIVGKEAVEGMEPVPMAVSPALVLKEGEGTLTQSAWYYVGAKVTPGGDAAAPATVERLEASFDASKSRIVQKGERAIRFVSADALAPGRYALLKKEDRRLYVIDFGAAQPAAPPAPAAPPEPAGG